VCQKDPPPRFFGPVNLRSPNALRAAKLWQRGCGRLDVAGLETIAPKAAYCFRTGDRFRLTNDVHAIHFSISADKSLRFDSFFSLRVRKILR